MSLANSRMLLTLGDELVGVSLHDDGELGDVNEAGECEASEIKNTFSDEFASLGEELVDVLGEGDDEVGDGIEALVERASSGEIVGDAEVEVPGEPGDSDEGVDETGEGMSTSSSARSVLMGEKLFKGDGDEEVSTG